MTELEGDKLKAQVSLTPMQRAEDLLRTMSVEEKVMQYFNF